ncbi:MAG: TRAP transporter substrate-binding protein DctP [Acidobacteriota bacterium]|nr:TRAP transporter substrate-binding protein DctP [Acidobacteriota bacterium]
MKKALVVGLLASSLAVLIGAAPVTAKVRIKLATILPENSPQFKLLEGLAEQWKQISGGEVDLVLYGGGVQGDESDVIRKMRIGQLQAGALSVNGLTDLVDEFSLFEIPLFFENWDEFNHVLADLTPTFQQKFDEAGYVWLTWGHVGWVHFFTTTEVERLDDLRKLKVFTWAGNEAMVQWWKANGFKPVALPYTDAVQGLKTGMIETMIAPPLIAAQMGFFEDAPYMIDVGLTPLIGAFLVQKRTWDKIDSAYRDRLLTSAQAVGKKLEGQTIFLEETSINVMKNNGLKVLAIRDSEHSKEWLDAALKFADQMRGGMVDAQIFDQAKRSRDAFRKANAE